MVDLSAPHMLPPSHNVAFRSARCVHTGAETSDKFAVTPSTFKWLQDRMDVIKVMEARRDPRTGRVIGINDGTLSSLHLRRNLTILAAVHLTLPTLGGILSMRKEGEGERLEAFVSVE